MTRPIEWRGEIEGTLVLLDQTLLPTRCEYRNCKTVEDVFEAIRSLRVRGAPAIGVSAAYGMIVGLQTVVASPEVRDDRDAFDRRLREVSDYLASSRPTAVNLFWAIERMRRVAAAEPGLSPTNMTERLLAEARAIEDEDRQMCSDIGRHGAELLTDGMGVLTHCNAGSLATAGDGTALAVIYAAVTQGKTLAVYADETRPLLQGARLTAWELQQRGVPVTLICDSMAGHVMKEKRVQAAVVGADRIAANGDTANKIGTYTVAVLAARHKIPFYVAAPSSTFDLSLATGDQIPIEERSPEEITALYGCRTAPEGINVYNPAFDVTPAELITAIITEKGLIRPVTAENVKRVLAR